jgi:hypothetical protein
MKERFKISLLNEKKSVRKAIRYVLVAAAGLILLSLVFRNSILSWYVDRKIVSFNKQYHAELTVDNIRIRWLSSIRITGIMLRPEGGDTLLKIDTATARLNFFRMIFGRIALSDFELRNTTISLVRHDTVTNYMFLLDRLPRSNTGDTLPREINFAGRLSKIFDAVFDKIPGDLVISNFDVRLTSNGHFVGLFVDRFAFEDHQFRFPVAVREDTNAARWIVEGRLDKSNRLVQAKVFTDSAGPVKIPYIRLRWNAGLSFDTLSFSLTNRRGEGGTAVTEGSAGVAGLTIEHPRVALQPVVFRHLGVAYRINTGKDYIELDSATRVTFELLAFNPYIRYQADSSKKITLRMHTPWFPAQDLVSSLPEGLFTEATGMEVTGELAYDLDFFVDLSCPDSLKLASDLRRRDFRILKFGQANLFKLDSSFQYTAYEQGEPVRTFTVGPENPDFRALSRISPYLQYSVLTSEDGGFYQHRGFLMDALRESIATNIKERRFARGGSTITMQLVKNVFLSRNKTIARKLEEILITWLIENQQIATKERMFEVYLNIIEWGPLVYGANEASRFYFSKDASRLTYAEAIFLASVIPKPKWFRSSFDSAGHLRPDMADYYRLVSEKMLRKGWVTQQDVDRLVPDVELKGPAKALLGRKDPFGLYEVQPEE